MDGKKPISEWEKEKKPRERLLTKGVNALLDSELIALLLNTGTKGISALELAENILKEISGIGGLGKISPSQLASFFGVGPAKAARILAACELGRRREGSLTRKKEKIQTPKDAILRVSAQLQDLTHECLLVLMLDTKHNIIGETIVSRGGLDQTLVQPREVFRPALDCSAAAVIIAHNHPSGDPEPSQMDIQLTERLHAAAQVLGINFLDHIIIGEGIHVSLAEKGYFKKK